MMWSKIRRKISWGKLRHSMNRHFSSSHFNERKNDRDLSTYFHEPSEKSKSEFSLKIRSIFKELSVSLPKSELKLLLSHFYNIQKRMKQIEKDVEEKNINYKQNLILKIGIDDNQKNWIESFLNKNWVRKDLINSISEIDFLNNTVDLYGLRKEFFPKSLKKNKKFLNEELLFEHYNQNSEKKESGVRLISTGIKKLKNYQNYLVKANVNIEKREFFEVNKDKIMAYLKSQQDDAEKKMTEILDEEDLENEVWNNNEDIWEGFESVNHFNFTSIKDFKEYRQNYDLIPQNQIHSLSEKKQINEDLEKIKCFEPLQNFSKFEKMDIETKIAGNSVLNNKDKFENFYEKQNILRSPIFELEAEQKSFIGNMDRIGDLKRKYQEIQNVNYNTILAKNKHKFMLGDNDIKNTRFSRFTCLTIGEDKEVDSNWVFVYDLPYDFHRSHMKEELTNSLDPFGKVEKILLYRCSDLEKLFYERLDNVKLLDTKKNNNNFDEYSLEKLKTYLNQFDKNEELKSSKNTLLKDFFKENDDVMDTLGLIDKKTGNINIEDSKKLFQKFNYKELQKKSFKKQNSYAFVKFKTQEQKNNLLEKGLSNFGISSSKNIRFYVEDADYKKTIIIESVLQNTSLFAFINFLNFHFKENGITPIPFTNDIQGIMSGKEIFISFPCLEEALKASFLINQLEYNGSILTATFLRKGVDTINGKKMELPSILDDEFILEFVENYKTNIQEKLKTQSNNNYLNKANQLVIDTKNNLELEYNANDNLFEKKIELDLDQSHFDNSNFMSVFFNSTFKKEQKSLHESLMF